MRRSLAPLVIAQAVLCTTWARAQADPEARRPTGPTAADVATSPTPEVTTLAAEEARRLGMAGLSAYNRSLYAEALPLFEEAEAVAHSPVFQLYIARCHLALGQDKEARALLLRLSEQPELPDDPQAWRRARSQANLELAQLAPDPNDAEEPPASTREISNSVRTAVATGHSHTGLARTGPASDTQKRGLRPTQKGALAAFGTAAAALVLTLITGGMAIAEATAVKQGCAGTSCREEDLPRAAQAERLANIASAGAVSAAVGVSLGTALLFWPNPEARPMDKAESSAHRGDLPVDVRPGPARTGAQTDPRVSVRLRTLGFGLALQGTF